MQIIITILMALAAKAFWRQMKASQNKFLQYAYGVVMLICSYISLGIFSPILGLMSAVGYPIIFKPMKETSSGQQPKRVKRTRNLIWQLAPGER